MIHTYNGLGQVESDLLQNKNGSIWVDSIRTDFYYDVSGNKIIEYQFDYNLASWDSTEVRFYHYNVDVLLDTLYAQILSSGNWINSAMQIFEFGPLNRQTHHYFLEWDGSEWLYQLDSVSEVDANGFPSHTIILSAYYTPTLMWTPSGYAWRDAINDSLGNVLTWEEHYEDGRYATGECTYSNSILVSDWSEYMPQNGVPIHTHSDYYYAELFGDTLACTSTNNILSLDTCPGNTYLWTTGDTTSSIQISSPGIYQATITHANGWVVQTPPIHFNITGIVPYIVNTNDSIFMYCASGPVQYLNSPYQNDVNYQWYFNNTALSTGDSSSLRSNGNGTYFLIASNGCGSDTSSITQVLLAQPNFSTLTQTPAVCAGDCTGQISLTAYGIDPLTYSWSTGDTTQSIQNLCAGFYSITISDSLGCIKYQSFSITSDLISAVSTSRNTSCTGCDDGIIHLSVSNNGSPYNLSISPSAGIISGDSITNLPPGIYEVCVTDNTPCTFCQTDTILEDPTGIDFENANGFSLFPNPTHSNFTITQTANILQSQIYTLENILGEIILSGNLIEEFKTIDLSTFQNGIYFLRLNGKFREGFKVIKN